MRCYRRHMSDDTDGRACAASAARGVAENLRLLVGLRVNRRWPYATSVWRAVEWTTAKFAVALTAHRPLSGPLCAPILRLTDGTYRATLYAFDRRNGRPKR